MTTNTLPSNAQWIRKAQLVVGKAGNGLLVDNLKITFEINKTIQPSPNTALIKVYNLNPNNSSIIHDEYTDIILNAGYQNNLRILFSGNIKNVFRYRDKTDWITEMECADGDNDYRNSTLNLSLSAGTDRTHIINAAAASFKNGTTLGHVDIDSFTNMRGVVLTGNTRDVLHRLSRDAGANWSIQDGRLTIVKTDKALPNTAIVINSQSGMLAAPEINDKGIAVRTLLNPDIMINGVIHLDNNNIRIRERKTFIGSARASKVAAKALTPTRLDPDGLYKVICMRHMGDNRGKDWVTELSCIGLSQPIPASSESTNAEE